MLQGVGEDGENMRNLLFSVFSRFSLLLPILSPTPEEINPHSFGFSMQTWEEIPTVSVLLAGNRGGIQGSLHGLPRVPHPVGVCQGCPSRACSQHSPAEGPGDTSDFCSDLPHPSHTAPNDLPIIIITTKAVEMLAFFPYHHTGRRLLGFQAEPCKRLQGDLVRGTEPLLCCPSAAKTGSHLSPARTGCSMWHSPSTTGSHLCCSHHTLLKSKLIEIISAPQPIHKCRINKAGSMTLIYQ